MYHDDAGRIRILEIRANLGGISKHVVQLLVRLGIPHACVLPKMGFFVYSLCVIFLQGAPYSLFSTHGRYLIPMLTIGFQIANIVTITTLDNLKSL